MFYDGSRVKSPIQRLLLLTLSGAYRPLLAWRLMAQAAAGDPAAISAVSCSNLALQAAHILERSLCKNRELLWLAGEDFLAQRGQGLIHSLQFLHRLGQDGIGLVHRRTRNSPSSIPALRALG